MKSLDKFKEESLEINEQLTSQGGDKKNDNSGGRTRGEATEITTAHPDGEDVRVISMNDDKTDGDSYKLRHIYPD